MSILSVLRLRMKPLRKMSIVHELLGAEEAQPAILFIYCNSILDLA